MTDELIHEIEWLNYLERQLEAKWGRGDHIPDALLVQIEHARINIHKLNQLPENQTINK